MASLTIMGHFVFYLVAIVQLSFAKNYHLCNTSAYQPIKIQDRLKDSFKMRPARLNITLCDYNKYILSSKISYKNKDEVIITGNSLKTTIHCTKNPAGIQFHNVTSVVLKRFTLRNCGSKFKVSYIRTIQIFNTAIAISHSKKLIVDGIKVTNSYGTSLAIVNSTSRVIIKNSIFSNGRGNSKISGGSGLYFYNRCINNLSCFSFSIQILNCTFRNNSNNYTGNLTNNSMSQLGNGGGLCIFAVSVRRSNITIKNCDIASNSAHYWGGGLNVVLKNSTNIKMSIDHCNFINNSARIKGGGGVNIGYLFSDCPKQNNITFSNSQFVNNFAHFGGGAHVFSSAKTCVVYKNIIMFKNCTWKKNRAHIAAAFQAIPQFTTFNLDNNLPPITFDTCYFYNNTANFQNNHTTIKHPKGSFLSLAFRIVFKYKIIFEGNTGTALYLISSTVEVRRHTFIHFHNNSGHYGGAIALYRSSTLNLRSHVDFIFTSNSALIKGGAIYQESSSNSVTIGQTNCFLHSLEKAFIYNTYFTFMDNHIVDSNRKLLNCSDCGKSIFMYSTKSCTRVATFTNHTTNKKMKFTFMDSLPEHEISTWGILIKFNSLWDYGVIPGKSVQLPITVHNDFSINISRLILVVITNSDNSSNIETDAFSTHIFNQHSVTLLGKPGSSGNMSLSLSTGIDSEIRLSITMLECPPGYVYKQSEKLCKCSVNTDSEKYVGISHCNASSFQALLRRSYWIGYIQTKDGDVFGKEKELYGAQCPARYCNVMTAGELLNLPKTSNVSLLDELICGPRRTGVMCAKCRENNSAFYHAENFDCKPNKKTLCSAGWFFYFLSELLPVTVVFLLIILFNIQLTSGHLQGFILYAQIFNTLMITANGQIVLSPFTNTALKTLEFIYRMFDLEFFTSNALSFCLWQGASSLDVLAMKYVTIVYSLILVTVVVILLRRFTIGEKIMRRIFKKRNTDISIIHGLSGFLILCYSQCTKVSLLILTPATLYIKGPKITRQVSFYNGNLPFLKGYHLAYAIPAILSSITLVVLPPLLFIVYPLCYKVFSLLHIQESYFSTLVCTIIPLEKFKPFFDSFQGSFKDEHRYFAGLYFLFRLVPLLSFVIFHDLSSFYSAVQTLLLLILFVHTWVQPYRQKWHNRLDACIFGILATINRLTQYNYDKAQDSSNHVISSIQVALACIPLIYFCIFYGSLIAMKLFSSLKESVFMFQKIKTVEEDIFLNSNNERNSNLSACNEGNSSSTSSNYYEMTA